MSGEDVLNATSTPEIATSFNETTGVLSLDGEATAAEFESVLQSVTFENISEDPTVGTRVIELSLTSGDNESTATRNVEITAVNDPLELEVPIPFSTNPVVSGENVPIVFTAVASDDDDEQLTYFLDLDESNISLAANQPTIDPDTGLFEWTPSETGEFLVRIIVTNESGQANQTDILFDIEEV